MPGPVRPHHSTAPVAPPQFSICTAQDDSAQQVREVESAGNCVRESLFARVDGVAIGDETVYRSLAGHGAGNPLICGHCMHATCACMYTVAIEDAALIFWRALG